MFQVILNPIKAIEHEKKNRSIGKTIGKIIVGSLFLGIAALIVAMVLTNKFGTSIMVGLGFAVTSFIGNFVNAWIYNLSIKTLTGKGTYQDTLLSLANSLLIIGTGLMLSALLWLIPQVGVFLTMILLIITLVLAYSVLIKSLITFTGADLLSVIIGLIIVIFSSIMAAYLITTVTMLQTSILNPGLAGTDIQF